MLLSISLSKAAFLLGAIEFLSVAAASNVSVSTTETCQTAYCTKSAQNISTTTLHACTIYTQTCTVNTIPTTTKTPTQVTHTATSTTVVSVTATNPQSTDTATITETDSVTVTVYAATITSTETDLAANIVTSTSTIDATVIPTSAGFLPIQDTLPYSQAKKWKARRDNIGGSLLARAAAVKARAQPQSKSPVKVNLLARKYPSAVSCLVLTETYVHETTTSTAQTTITKTASAPTTTITTTTTSTITVDVIVADASTTVTATTTSSTTVTQTPSTVVTITNTETVTVPSALATTYAQCDPVNFAGAIGGNSIYDFVDDPDLDSHVTIPAAKNAQQCCNYCAANPLCASSAYFEPECSNILNVGVCTSQSLDFKALYVPYYGHPDELYSLSNGICGRFTSVLADGFSVD